jgi:hypothetical protein
MIPQFRLKNIIKIAFVIGFCIALFLLVKNIVSIQSHGVSWQQAAMSPRNIVNFIVVISQPFFMYIMTLIRPTMDESGIRVWRNYIEWHNVTKVYIEQHRYQLILASSDKNVRFHAGMYCDIDAILGYIQTHVDPKAWQVDSELLKMVTKTYPNETVVKD